MEGDEIEKEPAPPTSLCVEEYEAMCAISVLQDAIDRLHILGRILPIPMPSDKLSQSLALEKTDMSLGKKTSGRKSSRHELFPRSLMNQIQTQIYYDEDAFKLQRDRSFMEHTLAQLLSELQCYQTYESLAQTNQEESNRKQETLEMFENETANQQRSKDLTAMLSYLHGDREEQVTQLQETILHLNDTIQESKVKIYLEDKFVTNQTQAAIQQGITKFQSQEKEVVLAVEKMRKKLQDEKRINQEIETYVRRNLDDLEQKMEAWMEKYERQTDAKDRENELLQQELQSMDSRTKEIERLTKDYTVVIEEDHEAKRLEQLRREEEERQMEAAILIQSFWRGVMVRRFMGPYRKLKAFLKLRKKEMRDAAKQLAKIVSKKKK